ncbi:hypothetical protein Psi02_30410 [Planotetraspora silvatica]|uniref:Uncharacterized protein n=1 Tax=Planotetraspora silvatica TaxID=234614 RepID=A0A8J3UMU0_9ACTN|nr:hypothetical protein [Planotetraspora silvatica]GII46617.1 hypothetical protein Psi02_30410 [Planotetraspora silvatica]
MVDELRPNQVPEEARGELQDLLHHLVRLAGSPSVHRILLNAWLSREDYGTFVHTLHLASYLIAHLWDWFGIYLPDMFPSVTPYLCPHCGKQAWPRGPGFGFPNPASN